MQLNRFLSGGYVIHRILLQNSKGRFSAWFDKDGNLLDAEQIFDYMHEQPVVKGGPNWKRIAEIGKRFAICPA